MFAGAGGLSLGAQLAGVTVTHAIEENYEAAKSYLNNHPQTKVLNQDIRSLEPIAFNSHEKSILFGGPPCQGFSTSNQRTRNTTNPKNWLFGEFFRFAKVSTPEWIVLENVKGLRETAQGQFEALILAEMQSLGYCTAIWQLCATDFGVPQKRHRVFIIGRRNGVVPEQPMASCTRFVTVRQAISDLPELEVGAQIDALEYRTNRISSYARLMRQKLKSCTGHLVTSNNKLVQERYKHIPQGGNWRDIPRRLMKNYTNLVDSRSRHTGIYRRLEWDQPSVVIANYRKNMLVHPQQNRGLSLREAARLQSFPDNYSFAGSIGQCQQQISNAVPPLLAKAVFSKIIATF